MTKYSPDAKSGRLLPLQDKVTRITRSLARSSLATALEDLEEPTSGADLPEVLEDDVSDAVRAWRARSNYLPGELFSDPAWGMLLELLQAEIQQRRVSLSRLCNVSATSARSAVRWLKALEQRGLVIRQADPQDAGTDLFELAPKASAALRRYFRDIVAAPAF